MVLEEIKTRLNLLGTLGVLKIGSMPSTPDVIGVLYEYGGLAPQRGFGVVGIKYEFPACQIAFRGTPDDYIGPRLKANIAWRNLSEIQGTTFLSGTEYLQLDPIQSVFPVQPQDDNKRVILGFNFLIMKVPS